MNDLILNDSDWQTKLISYCNRYNIPVEYLAEIINEPKVIPMIRGKAFEFSVMIKLRKILSTDEWTVDKPWMNAQSGSHDIDILVSHKQTGINIRIECKLAAKDSYKYNQSIEQSEIRVKCMRSRTLGTNEAITRARILDIPEQAMIEHKDQYLPRDFDIVATSIGNSFYKTNRETGIFEWCPNTRGTRFLNMIREELYETYDSLQEFAYNRMYIAMSTNIAANENNEIICTRRNCGSTPLKCGQRFHRLISSFIRLEGLPLGNFQGGNGT